MPITILVVDDSAADRLIMKNALSKYCILTAGGGEEALRTLEEHDGINLLILDLNMPDLNGLQVLQSLKKEERFQQLRTIILTNEDEVDDEIKGLELGAVDYIRKPIYPASLQVRIELHIALLRAQQALEQEHKTLERALRESERSKSVFLSHLPGLAYRCNKDRYWTMQYVSEGCYNLTGYPPESLLYNRDLSYNDLIAPEYREAIWKEWDRILAKKQQFKYEYEIITATGERKWVLELGQGIYNEHGEVDALEGIILDISERKAIENALKYHHEHDRWTGLYNRNYLVSLLKRDAELKKGSKRALIGINLSTIQLLTLNYGFQYSQNLIKKAAEALRQHCTEHRLLFQPRENRFVFYLLDYKDQSELIDFSNTIVETLKSVFVTDRISGGIGILEIDQKQNEEDINSLLRRLVIASERSMSLFGRDFEICFYDDRLEALVNRERDIVEALNLIATNEQTDNHLFLQYQPILNLKTGLICGFEALARLRTEKLGLVSPAEFIPLAEKTKLILPIGEKVMVKAFSFLNKLQERGYDGINVSINISLIQLLKPDFTRRLFELMREMRVNPKNIGIEITESVFTADFENINNILEKLRTAGLYVAIDDFGTGYSSLAREKELKVDCMKIDKHFIDSLLDIDPNKAITCDIISISHKLGQCTVAEGVEHEVQLQYLKDHNCDRIQGYLISKPLNEEEAIKFLESATKK
ncbi:MAG TPA: EAL domain-containing protein [Firmicutes bacterium]|nr:EAL domain-containing protein [Bacillota bacterium]